MSITKKEHFIPRAALLRRFSNTHLPDDRDNKLVAYSVRDHRCYDTNVADSGAVNGLYEYDALEVNSVEQLLSATDSDLKILFDKIVKICRDPDNQNCLVLNGPIEKDNFKFFVALQMNRTERIKRHYQDTAENEDAGTQAFLRGLIGRDVNGNPVLFEYKERLKDHYFVFECNKTPVPFILPDVPIFLCHSSFDAQTTINYRFPLTPWLQILLVDPKTTDHEVYKGYRNRIRYIYDVETIQSWNKKSIETAFRTVYCTPGYGTISDGLFSTTTEPSHSNSPV